MRFYGDWAPGSYAGAPVLSGACVVLNLEGPILSPDHALEAAPKAGPSLFSTTWPRSEGLLVCSAANNHIMDYGPAGLAQTQQAAHEHGALLVGAGRTRAAARQPAFVDDHGVRVAIIACCERQFHAADDDRAGVAVMGPWVHDAIRACRAQADAVVVSVHAGPELSPWPAPTQQDLYRAWIDAGARVIHGHHAHLPQGVEEYHGGLILYGLGNLAVDPNDWAAYPDALWSLAVNVDFATQPPRYQVIPIGLHDAAAAPDHDDYLADCCRPLADGALLAGLHQEVALRTYHQYYRSWLRFTPSSGSGPRKASPQDHRLWYHLFACQTHSDLIATALGVLGGEIPDLRTPQTTVLTDRRLPWTVPHAAAVEARA